MTLFDRLGAALPVIQAPMAGSGGVALAAAAIAGGGVGSLPCAMLSAAAVVEQVAAVRVQAAGPLALNFFCHALPDDVDDTAWRAVLAPFYAAEGVADDAPAPPLRRPFDAEMADVVAAVRPAAVSFHFGLPAPALLDRVRASGAAILATATGVREAQWLAAQGVDAVIAQGAEAGGHAGYFLDGHHPVGLLALVPQIADAVSVPVIAAGGITDPRGAAAAIMLGAAGIQVGTAYLPTRQSLASAVLRDRLGTAASADSVFTNLFSGGLARGLKNRLIDALGPVDDRAPPFPLASAALAPLRARAEADGRGDYSPLWAGQGAPHATATDARALTEQLGAAARAVLETR